MSDSNLEKVLIIDDNSDYRKLIKTFINKLLPGVETIEYDPVFEGIPDDSFNWSEIDVLLLDYHLSIPGTTGLDVLHKYHKNNSFPATIMLTGAGTEEIAIRALDLGIHEYQPKQTLTKDKLKQSIIHAWEEKKSARIKQQEITQHNRSFSKEVFYENLEQALERKEIERALVVIKPDDIALLEDEIGIIGRDNLINYIAKNSFEVFKLGACNPNITKISDTEIGVQIDCPINLETLDFNMQGLSTHLAKCTFKFSEEKHTFSVSIGVLKLGIYNESAERSIYVASLACDYASKTKGNSHYIWKETDAIPKQPEPLEETENAPDDNEIILKTIEEKESLEIELKAEQEDKKRLEAELKIAKEAKAELKIFIEEEMKAAKKENEKLKAELKVFAEAKAKAEEEMKASKEEKPTKPEHKANNIITKEHTKSSKQDNDNDAQTVDVNKEPEVDTNKIETQIRKLIDEKRIIQTYQSVTAMFDDEIASKEIYKTDLSAISENNDLIKYLSDTSAFSISLQQTINAWILRQVFLRITESGTEKCQYSFLISATESWFSDITLFQWLQKILSQTKKYNPGKSIILNVPTDILIKHQKRAEPLINTLRKSHQFTIALSNTESTDDIMNYSSLISSSLFMVNIEQLKKLSVALAPIKEQKTDTDADKESDKKNMLQYLKSKNIRIITSGIEDSTLLMDAITAGTDYTLGNFVGEIQTNLVEPSTVESFELT